MAGTVAPVPRHQFLDNSGNPAVGYKLFSYVSGTTTKATTYTDQACSAANTNPIVLDAAGRCTIFLPTGASWKFVLALPTDTDPPASPIWTIDGVASVPGSTVNLDVTGTAGELLTLGNCVYLSAGDGGRNAGQWYNVDADTDYMSLSASMIGFALSTISASSTGSIRISGEMTGLAGLAAGSLYYVSQTTGGIVTPAPATNPRVVGMANSATTLLMAHWLPENNASATVPGLMTTGTQTFAGAKTWTGAASFGSTVAITGNATVGGTLGVTGAATLASTLDTTGKITSAGGMRSSAALEYQSGISATIQQAFLPLTVAPTGIPGSVAANVTANANLTGITGLLATDILIGIQKAATQAGLFILPADTTAGGVTGAGAATVKYVNVTTGAIVPTAAETYTFIVLRLATVGTSQYVASRVSAVPTGIPGSVAANVTANANLTGITGLLATDILIGVESSSEASPGTFMLPADATQGGVTGAGAVTIKFVNPGALPRVPYTPATYHFTVLRLATLGTQTLTPAQVVVAPSGIPGSVAALTLDYSIQLVGVTGIISTDILFGAQKAGNQNGLFIRHRDFGNQGGVAAAAITNVEYVNVSAGAITPTAGEIYTFTVLRLTVYAAPALSVCSGVINGQSSIAGVGNSAASETTLFTYTLPGGILSTLGHGLRITAFGTIANNANTKTLRVYFGAVQYTLAFTVNVAHAWFVVAEIWYVTSTTQVSWLRGASALPALSSAAGSNYVGNAAPTADLSQAQIIKMTGQSSAAGGTNDILCNGMSIEVLGA